MCVCVCVCMYVCIHIYCELLNISTTINPFQVSNTLAERVKERDTSVTLHPTRACSRSTVTRPATACARYICVCVCVCVCLCVYV